MHNKKHKYPFLYLLIIFYSISYSSLAYCQSSFNHEFILFPYLDATYNSNLDSTSSLDNDEYAYGVNLFATFEFGKFRFLGEYLLAKDEQEIERLQLGWLFGNNNRRWLGRFHNPIGFWNTQYHHGEYLETGISKPAIVEYEDDNGPLPMHLAGLLYEGLFENDDHGLGYVLAIGAGPEIREELEAWDPSSPGSGTQDISATINLYFEPVLYTPTRYGLFASYSEIPAKAIGFDEIRQIISGAYGNWQSTPWHIIASFFYVHNRIDPTAGSFDEAFMQGYIQSAYEISDKWTLYGRIEGTISDKNDDYLALFPGFIEDRLLGGIRFDFINQNALKMEISENHTDADNFFQFKLQWSAVF